MSVVRYECPRCQSVFVPVEPVTAGSYARCPTCGGLSVPCGADDDDESTAPLKPAPVSGVGLPQLANPAVTSPTSEMPGGVFASLMGPGSLAFPSAPAEPAGPTNPDDAPPAVTGNAIPTEEIVKPGAGGLFTSLLMSASDLELSGRRVPVVDAIPSPITIPPGAPSVGFSEEGLPPLTMPQSAIHSAEFTLPAGLGVMAPPADVAGNPLPKAEVTGGGQWDIANTGMLLGPADPLPSLGPPPPGLQGLTLPPVTGPYLDQQTFSDKDFEAMLGGSFSPQAAEPSGEHSLPDQWVVSNPGAPPPLKKMRDSVPPPPPPKAKPSTPNPATLVVGLPPIPTVASLGKVPRLGDGISVLKVAGLLLSGLLLGGLAGAALAPPPPRPPQSGTEGALHKLGEARKLLAQGKETEAVAMLQAALVLDRNLAEAQRDLGVALGRQERFEDAARAYEAYLEMAPRAPDAFQVETTLKAYRAGDKKP